MGDTSIQWTDKTWNPVRGCSRVSQGCVNCYAERQAARFATGDTRQQVPSGEYTGSAPGPFHGFVAKVNGHPSWTGKVELVESHLEDPLHWRKPKRVFVNSMSDLFHEALSDSDRDLIFAVMNNCPQHQFQILTKRQANMQRYITELYGRYAAHWNSWPLPNVWLGVSVEDQATADERIPLLLSTPAAKRFVSYEPALGPVDFLQIERPDLIEQLPSSRYRGSVLDGRPRLDWVIVGGESGPGARPFYVDWARNTVAQCRDGGVACFVKQLGAAPYLTREADGAFCPNYEYRFKDRKGGDMAEWPEDLQVREFPFTTGIPQDKTVGVRSHE